MKRPIFSKLKDKKNIVLVVITIIIFCMLIISIYAMNYYRKKLTGSEIINSEEDTKVYSMHYALILDNSYNSFGESIFEGAKLKGEELGVYIDNFGDNLLSTYSVNERLKMAIASKVDGIIVQANTDKEVKDLINQAVAEGIPVVTILDDAPLSDRISFAGVNQYQLGKYYGNQILKIIKNSDRGFINIKVLIGANEKEKGSEILFSGIKDCLLLDNIKIEPVAIERQSAFSSEETVHNIITDAKSPPDIIVCLNMTDTISAYQTVVDYNMVGQVEIIGYYNSEKIQSAINKNIIDSTIVINTKQLGQHSVEMLSEYLMSGIISEYVTIDIDIDE